MADYRLTFKQFLEEEEEDPIYAKKLGDNVPSWSPSLAEGSYRVGEVTFSSEHGLGQVPNNQSVYHFGFVVMMRPSTFAMLATADDGAIDRAKKIAKLILKGYSIGPPFLDISLGEEDIGPAKVMGHEGRARMIAVQMANGDELVPVHCFLRNGLKGEWLTPSREGYDKRIAAIKEGFFAERSSTFIAHPFESMYVKGKKV